MLKAIAERLRQGYRTVKFPKAEPGLPDLYRGLPVIDAGRCLSECSLCQQCCPVEALVGNSGHPRLDMGRCLFCGECEKSCPEGAIQFTHDYSLAARRREDLVLDGTVHQKARTLEEKTRKLFGHSLRLRQVSAGGCNACEADLNVLTTVVFDLARFGIQFVAAPRHADGLLITGPVTKNMQAALLKTYEAVPEPKIVIVVGACAISGGPYRDHEETHNGVTDLLPVDLLIPGCPPHPITILDGLLRLIDRI